MARLLKKYNFFFNCISRVPVVHVLNVMEITNENQFLFTIVRVKMFMLCDSETVRFRALVGAL